MEIHFFGHEKVGEKSWKIIVEKEWSLCTCNAKVRLSDRNKKLSYRRDSADRRLLCRSRSFKVNSFRKLCATFY